VESTAVHRNYRADNITEKNREYISAEFIISQLSKEYMDLTADRPPFGAEDPPDLSSQANILKHLKRVATQIEEGKLRYVDKHYIKELNKIEGEFDYEIFLGRTPEEDLEEEEKEYLFDEFGNFETVETFAGTTPYISTVYSALILYYLNALV